MRRGYLFRVRSMKRRYPPVAMSFSGFARQKLSIHKATDSLSSRLTPSLPQKFLSVAIAIPERYPTSQIWFATFSVVFCFLSFSRASTHAPQLLSPRTVTNAAAILENSTRIIPTSTTWSQVFMDSPFLSSSALRKRAHGVFCQKARLQVLVITAQRLGECKHTGRSSLPQHREQSQTAAR